MIYICTFYKVDTTTGEQSANKEFQVVADSEFNAVARVGSIFGSEDVEIFILGII